MIDKAEIQMSIDRIELFMKVSQYPDAIDVAKKKLLILRKQLLDDTLAINKLTNELI